MQRDFDLIRSIMLYIEVNYQPGDGEITVKIDGVETEKVYEHCKLLKESGLIQSFTDSSCDCGCSFSVGNMTSEGFDYLDKVRDITAWKKTKSFIKAKGLPMIIETVKRVASAIATSAMEAAIAKMIDS